MHRLGHIVGLSPEAAATLYLDVAARVAERDQQLPDIVIPIVPSARDED